MKIQNKVQYLIIFGITVFHSNQSFAYGQLELTISMDKKIFLVDEPIWFELTEKNIGENNEFSSFLDPWLSEFCQIILKDTQGKTWPYKGHYGLHFYQPDYPGFELEPNQTRKYINELHGIFGDRDENHRIVFNIPPGHYTLMGILNSNYHWIAGPEKLVGGEKPGIIKIVDKKTVFSNIVEFDIVEPKGVEKRVHEKLIEAYRLTLKIKKGSDVKNQISPILESILEKNPLSVYSVAAHKLLKDINRQNKKDKRDQIKDLVRFRNQIYSFRLIQDIDKKSNFPKYEEIKKKYPDSKLAKYIDHEFKYGRWKEQQ